MAIENGNFYLIEKANGIKYMYAWLDNDPDVRTLVALIR